MDRNENPRSGRGQGTVVFADGRDPITAATLHDAVRAVCAEVGIVERDIPADGQWHKTDIDGDPRGRGDGRIKLFPDGEGGIVCNWKGETLPFFVDDGRKPTEAERRDRERRRADAIRLAQEEEARRHAKAREKAAEIWKAATPAASDHAYLARKRLSPVASLREIEAGAAGAIEGYAPTSWGEPLAGRLLVVPVKVAGELSSVEFIDEAGRKSALHGGKKSGGFWAAQSLPNGDGTGLTMLIGEGVATVLSAREATGYLVIAALSCGNLLAVAREMRERYPKAVLVVLADLVKDTGEPDPHATEAARAVGGRVAIPDFGEDRPEDATDFNDMAVLCGIETVRSAIAGAAAPGEDPRGSGNEEGPDTGASPGADSASSEWAEPQPIQATLHLVPAFDPDTLLPEALRGWITDEADRMLCPPDFIAAAALVALGSIIGARCAIKPKAKDDWLIVPNLWGGIVGLPSAKKSPAIDKAMKPQARLIAQAMEEHRAAVAAFETDKLVFEAKEEAIKGRIKAAAKDTKSGPLDSIAKELQGHRQQAPKAPILRRYKSNDTTVEKLGELLRENPHGLLVLRDELVGLVASWEKEGREGDRAFFLEAWNGNARFDTDRIKRGSLFIPNLCVSIFGGIQPDKLTVYLEQAAHALANDGMLQRFQLLVYPDHCPWEWRDRLPDKSARDRAFAVFDALADFDPVAWGASPADGFAKFPYFRFVEAAQEIFIEWSGDMHRTRLAAAEHPIIAQHLAKFDKLFPALALILHLVECAATGQQGPVTAEAALRAAAWCEYLEAHARRCYGLLADDGLRSAQALADKVRQGKLVDGFTARDVRRNQWRYLTTDEAVQAALDWLDDKGWLRTYETGTGTQGGRPTLAYRINPKAVRPGKPGGRS